RLRGAFRGEPRFAHPFAAGPTRYLVGQVPLPAHRSVSQSTPPRRTSAYMGWRRRQSSVGRPSRSLRAALMLAVIGGPPVRFEPLVDLYKRALDKYGY